MITVGRWNTTSRKCVIRLLGLWASIVVVNFILRQDWINIRLEKETSVTRLSKDSVTLTTNTSSNISTPPLNPPSKLKSSVDERTVAHHLFTTLQQVAKSFRGNAPNGKPWPRTNITHAELVDGDNRWWIEKCTKQECTERIFGLHEKFRKTDPNHLDIISGWGFPALLEMNDKKNREGYCLRSFYDVWEASEPFSGEPFFDWLDHGSGQWLERTPDDCLKSKLNSRSYYIMDDAEVNETVVKFEVKANGNDTSVHLVFEETDTPVSIGDYLSVWDVHERLLIFEEGHFEAPYDPSILYWKQGHCSGTGGMPVLYAGEVGVGSHNGNLLWTAPESGHYRPLVFHSLQFFRWMRDVHRIPFSALEWRPLASPYGHNPAPLNGTAWEKLFNK